MVATGLVTCGRVESRLARYDVAQLSAGALGGMLPGGLLAVVVSFLGGDARVRAAIGIFGAVVVTLMFAHPLLRRWSAHLANQRQVPQRWARRSPAVAGAMYGFVLGTGFATRTPAPWPQLLAVASLAVGSPTTVVIAWAVYGGTRAIMPIAARRRGFDSRMITTYTTRTRHAMHLLGTAIAALLIALPLAIH